MREMDADQNIRDHFPKRAAELAVQHKVSDYRQMAAMCLDIANMMPLGSDRVRMMDMVQKWLELAQRREAEKLSEASQPALL
jgi:aryl carrier-like protein